MAKPQIIIDLSPTRLEAALLRGDTVASRLHTRLDLPDFAERWPSVLTSLSTQLADMVKQLGAEGAQATVLYSGPSAATGVFSCAQGAGAAQAARAARLALADAAGFPLDANPHDLAPLATDRGRASDSEPLCLHTLGVADSDATAQAIAAWLTAAGLDPHAVIPGDVPGLVAAVDAALGTADSGVSVVLFAGEHRSSLAAASDGRVRFIRQNAIGTESLIHAWTREIRVSATGASVTLDAAAAAELLFAGGIPERTRVVDAARGITGDALLPLVQPILQRCIVDIKQSLRFGLDEAARQNAVLHIIGPGAAIPGFARLIADQVGLKAGPAPASPGEHGAIPAWLGGRRVPVNLLPRGLSSQRTGKRLRRGLWVGVAAALGLIVADTVMTRIELSEQASAAAGFKARLDGAASSTTLLAKLTATQAGVSLARQRAATRLDISTEWDAALVMLATATPAKIRLTQVSMMFDNGKPVCRLTGRAPATDQANAGGALQAYMDALAAIPIVQSCRLGATQRSESADGAMQNFDMTLTLVELPPTTSAPGAAFTAAQDPKEPGQ